MKKNLISVLLIGTIFIFGAYSLITGSDNRGNSAGTDLNRTNIINNSNLENAGLSLTIDKKNNTAIDTDHGVKEIHLSTANMFADRNGENDEKGNIENYKKDNEENDTEGKSIRTASISLAYDSNLAEEIEERESKKETVRTTAVSTTKKAPAQEKRVSLLEQIKVHQVEKGENLWEIAAKYDIDIDTLIGANDIANMNTIQIGDTLRILPIKGILYKINPGESLSTISKQFNILIDKIVEANEIKKPDLVQPGMTIILPGAKPEFGYQDRLGKRFIHPVNARISSYFGARWGKQHKGIDFAVNTGTEVKAARAGKVVYSQWATGYGYTVVIEHQKGVRTLYAHNSRLLVHGGQWVEQGQAISLSGNTGNSTGPHVHFEVQINGQAVNPLNYIE